MKIKEGFELRQVCGEYVIIATGFNNIDFSKVISLNESAALMWKNVIDREFTVADLTKVLTDEYDVEESVAAADAQKIADSWKEIGLLD